MRPTDQRTAEGMLFTDQYQLTMAQLYFRTKLIEVLLIGFLWWEERQSNTSLESSYSGGTP